MAKRRRIWRWAAWGLLLGAVALAGIYAWLTNPARLRAHVQGVLARLPLGDCAVAEVNFLPPSQIELVNVALLPRHGAGDAPPGTEPQLRARRLIIDCSLLGLVFGQVRPQRVSVEGLEVTLRWNPAGGNREWDFSAAGLNANEWALLRDVLAGALPPLDAPQADVRILQATGRNAQLYARWLADIRGRATASGYGLEVHRAGVPDSDSLLSTHWTRADGQLVFALGDGEISALRPLLPDEFDRVVAASGLNGRVHVERLVYALPALAEVTAVAGGNGEALLAAAEIRLSGVHGAVPIEAPSEPALNPAPRSPGSCFLQFRDGEVRLTYQCDQPGAPGRLRLSATGALNGAPLSAALALGADVIPRLVRRIGERAPADEPLWTMADVVHGELMVSNVLVPTLASAPALLESPRLPRPIHSAFRDYAPEGRVDVRISVAPLGPGTDPSDPARVEALVTARETDCTPADFPYRFTGTTGRVHYLGGRVLLEDLSAQHGSTRVQASGTINSTHSWAGFNVTFRGRNVALERALYAALPPDYQGLWRESRPLGVCDTVVTLWRPDGTPATGPAAHDVQVRARLISGSLDVATDQRLTDADGWLTIHGGRIRVHDLHGYDGPTAMRLSGEVTLNAGHVGEADLRVVLADVPAAHTLNLPDASAAPQAIEFVGRADAWGRVWERAGESRHQHVTAYLKSGMLTGLDPARTWKDAHGWIVLRDGEQRLFDFEAAQGAANLRIDGRVASGAPTGEQLQLELAADTPTLDGLVPQFVPSAWRALVEGFGVRGRGVVRAKITPQGADRYAADFEVQAATMQADPLPLDLHDVQATVAVGPQHFALHQATAAWGPRGRIQAQGSGAWDELGVAADMAVSARGMSFAPELIEALPGPLAAMLRRLSPTGEFDADLTRVRVRRGSGTDWEIAGRIPLRQVRLELGLEISELVGTLSGTCKLHADGSGLVDGEFEVHSARVARRPLTGWHGNLRWDASDGWVRMHDLHGELCDGEAVAAIALDPGTSAYTLAVTLRDVSLDQLFPPAEDRPADHRRGVLDGRIQLEGRGDDTESRRGSGELRIRGGSFLHTPVLASVAEAGRKAQARIGDELDQVDVSFLWEGSRLRLLRVEIQSRDVRMIGEGWWDLRDDTVRLTLVGARPRDSAHVPLLSDFFESAGRELIQYEVEGPLVHPKVTTRPLYKLDDTLRALLGVDSAGN